MLVTRWRARVGQRRRRSPTEGAAHRALLQVAISRFIINNQLSIQVGLLRNRIIFVCVCLCGGEEGGEEGGVR